MTAAATLTLDPDLLDSFVAEIDEALREAERSRERAHLPRRIDDDAA